MTRIMINTKHHGPRIAPELYGQFAEHLGHCIYGGIYVGEDSPIPNVRGLRTDVVEALRALKVPVLRWPGGCFADEYHWKDGIGPRDQRPSMVNTHWGGVVENNHFGTHEFMDLCEQIGAEAYVNLNLGSGTVQEMQEWVEYLTCADLSSPMAKHRAANGHPEPWKVRWFGIGNENWGCGGTMCPDYYAQEYKRYQTYVRHYHGNTVQRIACGPSEGDYQWMDALMRHARNQMDHITLHMYTVDGPWENKGSATRFDEAAWYRLLHAGLRMDELISHHLSIMDRYDPHHRIGLIVDEWGTWHNVEPDTNPGFLFQQNTVRDAMLACMTLDIFHRYADRITMTNIAQMINVLQAMILTDGDQMVLTPTYHVFDLYKGHQGAYLLDTWHDADPIHQTVGIPTREDHTSHEHTRAITLPGLSHTASQTADGLITLTVSNPSLDRTQDLDIELTGATELEVQSVRCLRGEDGVWDSHNTFDAPNRVALVSVDEVHVDQNRVRFTLPPAGMMGIELRT